tara:strand:- start:8135 stop:8485 length:351 start_codon:yes stop_codon:yes gene_type:complete
MIGASILAVPIGFTEETWKLGETLPLFKVMGLLILSLFFISVFTYHHYYKHEKRSYWKRLVKRVFSTYILSFVVVAIILTLIERSFFAVDLLISIKRIIIVTFPSSMSAIIADRLK